jgi:uracil-DNA glycosylase
MEIHPLEQLQNDLRACTRCALAGYEVYAPPIFSGNANARAMIIGQAPGITEQKVNRPFNFTSGTRLFKWLAEAGWSEDEFRTAHYMASVTRCYPGRHPSGRGDRVPTRQEQELCAPWREAEHALLDLKLIIPVGKVAIGLFTNPNRPLTEIIGERFDFNGIAVVPLPHPSGASTWHMQPENLPYLARAIDHLREIREQHDL